MLEVYVAPVATCEAWAERVRAMSARLGWPEADLTAHRHRAGASLAFVAPEDQLFTATEVNEWAWLGIDGNDLGLPLPQAPGHPAAWDEDLAEQTLRRLANAERNPRLMALVNEASRRGLPYFHDEDGLTLGAGAGGSTWPLDALPDSVSAQGLHDIPTVLVTGSNGKTTTVRLLSAMFEQSGQRAGFNCTDGVFVGGDCVASGDYSGPNGARRVLRDTRVQAAVLETARGGILRRGLAVRHANAAIVTNISPDHFGEYGVHDLSDLADAKLVVARAITSDGVLVLNADDALLVAKASALDVLVAWFALDDEHPLLREQRMNGGFACGVTDGVLRLHLHGETHELGRVAGMPLTLAGAARYNIANVAGAALAAACLGIAPADIAAVLARFGAVRSDNPGRLERWDLDGIDILLDYAHNPEGLAGLLAVARGLAESRRGRVGLLLGQAGNRDDDAIRDLARTAASAQPDQVILKDLDGYMRGREAGEVPKILQAELLAQGLAADALRTRLDEVEASREMLAWAQAGDVVVLPVHNLAARGQVIAWLEAQGASVH